jgi:hypothetical protein
MTNNTYQVVWTEHKSMIIDSKGKKEAIRKAINLIEMRHRKVINSKIDYFHICHVTSKYYMVPCPECKQAHWTNQRCKIIKKRD